MEVKYVKWSIANNFGDHIELNENLPQYPKLHDAILEHELQHTDKAWSLQDFTLDFLKPLKCSTAELLGFMASRPSTWMQILPFYLKNGRIIFDINLSILWSFIIGFSLSVIGFIYWFL